MVEIANCSASQLVGSSVFSVAKGILSINSSGGTDVKSPLVLQIGEKFTFPIETGSVVGTKGDRSYVFSRRIALGDADSNHDDAADMKEIPLNDGREFEPAQNATLFLQVDFTAEASEEQLRKFELPLVEHGFLYVGLPADSDDLTRLVITFAWNCTDRQITQRMDWSTVQEPS